MSNEKLIGATVASGVLGMIGNRIAQNRQQRNQRELNEQGQQLGMQTWNETNYKAQMGQMRQAGLNPSLMYGKGGAGGATVAAPSGGSAPQAKQMDIGQTAAQGALLASQIKLNDATANKNQSEADLTAGGKTEGQKLQNTGQGITNSILELDRQLASGTLELKYDQFKKEVGILGENLKQELIRTHVDEETKEWKVVKFAREAVGAGLINDLTRAKTNLTKEQKIKVKNDVLQGWAGLDIKQKEVQLKKELGEWDLERKDIDMMWSNSLKTGELIFDIIPVGKVLKKVGTKIQKWLKPDKK
jgi:hypothetical protein